MYYSIRSSGAGVCRIARRNPETCHPAGVKLIGDHIETRCMPAEAVRQFRPTKRTYDSECS